MLLVATLVTIVWPIAGLNSLVQGVLISAAALLVAWMVLGLIGMQASRGGKHLADDEVIEVDVDSFDDDTSVNTSSRPPPIDLSVPVLKKPRQSSASSGRAYAAAKDVVEPAAEPAVEQPVEAEVEKPAQRASLLGGEPNPVAVRNVDQSESDSSPVEVQEQLDRVSDMVQSHDLTDPEHSVEPPKPETLNLPAAATDLLQVDSASTDLATLSTGQIKHLVSNLRRDKTRLQKLVIAQQSAIETERRSHEQSRTVARDAIVIMRDARNSQKLAEKLARRERSERQRVEQQYKKVSKALNNAMSIIEKRKQDDQSSGMSDDRKNGKQNPIEDILG